MLPNNTLDSSKLTHSLISSFYLLYNHRLIISFVLNAIATVNFLVDFCK